MKTTSRKAFTLIEVLIVVVIMAVLAAAIIPQFAGSTEDAKLSTALFNVHTLRSQIETYRAQHKGAAPSATLIELTQQTNADGVQGTGVNFPYGPYVRQLPENPFNGSRVIAAPGAIPPTAEVAGAGWLYDPASAQVWINKTGYFNR
jgi:prepilin-type N-terminal cleavage/methylation domain-containing protein